MSRSLVVENLPDDFDKVRAKLELYFKNKRRSGGEVGELQADPTDKRRAFLVYHQDAVLQKVLSRIHSVDFKSPLGLVQLQVKLLEDCVPPEDKLKPPLLPRPSKEKINLLKSTLSESCDKQALSPCEAEDTTADTHSLLVTSDKEKNFLQMYFEQYVSEPVLIKHGTHTWILQLSQSEQKNVLAKEVHEYGISVEVYNDGTSGGQLDPRRFILSGFDDTCSCSFVSVYIGSCSHGADCFWEPLQDCDKIVVTFKQEIDVKQFIKKCSTKKFGDKEIGVHRLELTDSILVEGNISEQALSLYFSNRRSKGGEIKSLICVKENKSAVITFEDPQVAHRVVEHPHSFNQEVLKVQLFYSSLQKTLSGQQSPQQSITTSVVESASREVLEFIIHSDSHTQELTSELQKVHASVSIKIDTKPAHIELDRTMDKECLGMLRLGQSWERNARRKARTQLDKYTVIQILTEEEVWKGIETNCLQLNTTNVSISFKSSHSEIVVVGRKTEVEALGEKVRGMVKKASEDLQIKRETEERKIQLGSPGEMDFIWHLISGKMTDHVGLLKDDGSFTICLTGLRDHVNTAEAIIRETQDNVISKKLSFSDNLLAFLNSVDLKKFEMNHFAQNNIVAALLPGEMSFQILANKIDLQRAEDKLNEAIKDATIDISKEQVGVTRSEQWKQFMNSLNGELESTNNDQCVSITLKEETVEVCGFTNVVADVLRKIKAYLENKTSVTVDVPLKSIQEVEFVESCMKLSVDPDLVTLGVTILPCKTKGSPCLKVTASKDKIDQAKDAVTLRTSAIVTEKHVYNRAGEAKILKKNDLILMAKAKQLECELNLSKSVIHQPSTTIHQQYSYNIEESVTLTLGQGNISQHASDALICPLNSMDFDNPIAQQFLHHGGPEIKKVIDKTVKEKQNLTAGDVVLTDPGTLKAKKLVYALIPKWQDGSSPLQKTYLQTAVHQSLVKANDNQCVSIGMPILGCSISGFPTKDSCEAIMKGIHDFITSSSRVLKNIHVIDPDAKLVAEFKSILDGLGYGKHRGGATANPSTGVGVQPGQVDSSSQPNTKVIGGISVTLKKGDITNEKVDVIVNSNNQNLNLDTGVSGAILKAAGQSVVDECKKHGSQKVDGVVLTGSGNLHCKHIAHVVGFNNATEITASIEKVLDLCKNKMASTVAIPTIGTGKGGMSPSHSAKAILKAVENFTSQTGQSGLKKVFIVAFEDSIFDSMAIHFNKKKKSRTSSKGAAGSTQARSPLPPEQVKICNINIEVRRGDITKETVKGIVNTTNATMDASSGVSGAIFRAAGSAVEQECQKIQPLKGDKVGVTEGGSLQCDFILHMVGPHSVADAIVRVTKVLQCCEENNITTVSFPAVGTGGGGLTGSDSVGAMLQGIQNHLSQSKSTALKYIYVVVDKEKIHQEFLQGFNQWKSNQAGMNTTSDDDSDEDRSSTSDDKTNAFEALIGQIKVKVFHGDIVMEKTDAIVNSTTTSLNYNKGASYAIMKAAGQTVVDECNNLGTQADDGVVITKPGNLPTKHIIHMVGQSKEANITKSVMKVLKMCEDHKIQSVSFPALGTGGGNLNAKQVGNAMLSAIEDLVLKIRKPSLTSIHIVIFQKEMMKDFEDAMKKFKKVTPISAAKKMATLEDTLHPTSQPTQEPTLCLASACKAVSFPAMKVEVIGCSTANLATVKKLIDDTISEEYYDKQLTSSQFHLLTELEKEAIVALSQKTQVSVLLTDHDKATISGKKDDVLAAVVQIKDFLQNAKEWESRMKEARMLWETVRWQVLDGEMWQNLELTSNLDVEQAFHGKRQRISIGQQKETFIIDLNTMQLTDGKGNTAKIRRSLQVDSDIAVIQPPNTWTRMDDKGLDIILLSDTSKEYKNVKKDFILSSINPKATPSAPVVEVVEIHRIQSKDQWQKYAVNKAALDKKYPNDKNERNLYHGTTQEICKKINKYGFNRSFCGRNATYYGQGTYFAKDAWYSCQDTYSNPDDKGLKYIYRARVLVGKPCLGAKGMKEPSPLNPNDLSAGLHDCAVDNLQKPFIFVVFCDAGAYPDYLITFKTS